MKSIVSSVCFACIFVFGTLVKADVVATYNVTTSNEKEALNQWKLASLFQTSTAGIPGNNNTNANELARDIVIANYLMDKTTVSSNGKNDGVLSKGKELQWDNVKALLYNQVGSSLGDSQSVSRYWLTAEDALTGGNPSGNAVYKNGYYAFQYSFDTDNLNLTSVDDLTQLYMNLSFAVAADDHLEAIFLNGQQIFLDYLYPSYTEQQFAEGTNFQGSARLSDIIGSGYFVENATNTLEFVIHNTGINGAASLNNGWGSYSGGENAFGIAVNGIIEIDTERKYDDSFVTPAATPEPATLLIMLIGIIGLVAIKCVSVRKGYLYFCRNTRQCASTKN
jgi:hypothetical protein